MAIRPALILPLAAVLAISGCDKFGNQPPPPAPAEPAATSTPASAAAAQPAPTGPAYVVPASLTSCTPQVATLHWNLKAEHPDVTDVEIYVGAPGQETLFAAGGYTGEQATGPWAAPGSRFSIRNKADGKVITEVVVQGPTCP